MFYLAYGLYIRSEIPLLGLLCIERSGESLIVDVTLHQEETALHSGAFNKQNYFEFARHNALIFWQNSGTFRVKNGQEIIIEPAQGVADHLLSPVLLGAVLPVLLLQRGFFVLHASAVALHLPDESEVAVAFLGSSEQGKSTMATALHQRGHRSLCDDVIALPLSDTQAEAPFLLHPALPHLKLRAPSVAAFGEDPNTLARWHPSDDSYVLRLSPHRASDPAPLRCLYVLEESSSLNIQRLDPTEALMFLMKHAYSIGLLPDDELEYNFAQCVRVAQQVPVFLLQRPKDFSRLPDVVRLVEEHQNALTSDSNLKIS